MTFRLALSVLVLAAAGSEPARFVDLAPRAGLNAPTVIGGERTKQYILETTGGGAAILDYDDDGWADIFLVGGARLDGTGAPAASTATAATAPSPT